MINAPYYGAYFVSQFLGTDGASVSMLSPSTDNIATYAVYSPSGSLLRALIYNSNYFDGTGARSTATVRLSGLPSGSSASMVSLTAERATVVVGVSGSVTIGGGMAFGSGCEVSGTQTAKSVAVSGGVASVSVQESEAVIVDFTG